MVATTPGTPQADPSGGSPPTHRRLLALTSLGHFVNDGTTFFVPVLAALLASGRGASPIEITAMLVVYYASSSLLSLSVGRWADRSGHPQALMAVGMSLLGCGMGGFYLALSLFTGTAGFATALVSAFVVGFGSSFYHPLGASLLQAGYERKELGSALGFNGAMGSVGRALYPTLFFLVGLVLTQDSAVLAFAAVGLLAAGVMVPTRSRATTAARPPPGPSRPPRAREAFSLGIVMLTLVAFVRSAANLGIVAFLPTYMHFVRPLWAGAPLGVEVTIMYLGGILGQPFFGLLADRADGRLLLGLSSLGAALGTLGFLVLGGAAAIPLLFLIGFFTFSAFPLLMTLSAEHVDPRSTSLANALVFGVGTGVGGVVGPLAVGLIASGRYLHLAQGFYAMILLGFVAAVAVAAIPRSGTRRLRMSLFG